MPCDHRIRERRPQDGGPKRPPSYYLAQEAGGSETKRPVVAEGDVMVHARHKRTAAGAPYSIRVAGSAAATGAATADTPARLRATCQAIAK